MPKRSSKTVPQGQLQNPVVSVPASLSIPVAAAMNPGNLTVTQPMITIPTRPITMPAQQVIMQPGNQQVSTMMASDSAGEVVSITGPMQLAAQGSQQNEASTMSSINNIPNTTAVNVQQPMILDPTMQTIQQIQGTTTMMQTMQPAGTLVQPMQNATSTVINVSQFNQFQTQVPMMTMGGTTMNIAGQTIPHQDATIVAPVATIPSAMVLNPVNIQLPVTSQESQESAVSSAEETSQNEATEEKMEEAVEGEEDDGEDHEEEEEISEKLTCKECDKTFKSKRDLLHHAYIHKENPKYICPICTKVFPSEPGYKRHVRAHQNRLRKNIPCGICNMVFGHRSELEEHHRDNHLDQKYFRCQVCSAQFSWHDNLKKHMRMHSNVNNTTTNANGEVSYKCNMCGATFMDSTSLRIHSRSHQETKRQAPKQYVCKVCNKEFKFDFSYTAHMNAHENSRKEEEAKAKSNVNGPIQLVTEFGEATNAPQNDKVVTEIQLPKTGTQTTREMMVQIVNDPKDVTSKAVVSEPQFTAIKDPPSTTEIKTKVEGAQQNPSNVDERGFVKSPFKGGRLPKPKVPTKRRQLNPILYDLSMTDDKPFECQYCSMKFRWEVSLRIHEREHDPAYHPPSRSARGRPRSVDVGKDYTYRIVRRRDSDEEEEFEEFEDIKTNQPRAKRRYRKKKDLENMRRAFPGGQENDSQNEQVVEATTVVRLTRRSGELVPVESTQHVQDAQLQRGGEQQMGQSDSSGGQGRDNATTVGIPDSMYVRAQKESINGMEVITLMPQTDGHTDDEGEGNAAHADNSEGNAQGFIEIKPKDSLEGKRFDSRDAVNNVYAVNHQGVHFQVVNMQGNT